MLRYNIVNRLFVHSITLALLLAATPTSAISQEAQNGSKITVDIGEPNVWSLGQAHYLLAQMRDKNQSWAVVAPNGFDPNATNGLRYDISRSVFGADAQFNGASGLQNKLNLQAYQNALQRRQVLQTQIDEALQNSVSAIKQIADLDNQLAQLVGDDDAIKRSREELTAAKNRLTVEKAAFDAQINTLKVQMGEKPELGSVATDLPFTSTSPALPSKDDLGTTVGKLPDLEKGEMPKIGASIALDNVVNLQYEMIAKQLTLLRDEVRPDERLIFLELPSDLYSVPKKDDDFLLQLKWDVKGYVGDPQIDAVEALSNDAIKEADCRDYLRKYGPAQSDPITRDVIDQFIKLQKELDTKQLRAAAARSTATTLPIAEREKMRGEVDSLNTKGSQAIGVNKQLLARLARQSQSCLDLTRLSPTAQSKTEVEVLGKFLDRYPSLRGKQLIKNDSTVNKFRVIDIIPRQSALNVNDTQGQQKGWALTAQFLTYFGLGGKVSYERQRTIYGQFMQQEVYASAFGKGANQFGWTFGPLPGTRRIAPGVRTTFAILAAPADAVSFDLHVKALVYHREKSPVDAKHVKPVNDKTFRIVIPGRDTERFEVNSATYRQVSPAERVTVTLRGRYFSPLTGVLVDGIPLKRAVSLANNENFTDASVTDADSHGEYEYLNSNEILLNFPIPAARSCGTPLITLVTPEHTETINSRSMDVNGERASSLDEQERRYPMFLNVFDETARMALERLSTANTDPVELRLVGAGFRREGKIFINDESLALNPLLVVFESTQSVKMKIPKAKYDKGVKVTYRLGSKSSYVTYTPAATTIEAIINPAAEAGKSEGLVAGGYDVLIRGQNLAGILEVFFGDRRAPASFVKSDNALVVKAPPGRAGTVYVLLFKQPSANGQLPPVEPANAGDLKADGKAVFTYHDPPKKQPAPQQNKQAGKSSKKQLAKR